MGRPDPAGHVLFVCTGNAARSVMAGAMFQTLAPAWAVATAGTHVIEGQPVSWRTREAMGRLGFAVDHHRSHQVDDGDLRRADLVVAFEGWHVSYLRRAHPAAAGRTATLRRWVRDLPPGDSSLVERIGALGLATAGPDPWEDVDDPAGGDLDTVVACAEEVLELTAALAATLTNRSVVPASRPAAHPHPAHLPDRSTIGGTHAARPAHPGLPDEDRRAHHGDAAGCDR